MIRSDQIQAEFVGCLSRFELHWIRYRILVIALDFCCIYIGLVFIKDRPVSSFGCFVFELGCFVFEFWVLRFRVLGASFSNLGASFSNFGCFVFEFWVLRASVFVFECFVFETTQCWDWNSYTTVSVL